MQKITSQEQLKDILKAHAKKVLRLIPKCDNEEQTKISLINPYLEDLGWDVRDPEVCRMEFAADYNTRKPEKVDYAIFHGGKVLILLEAKSATTKIPNEIPSQLQRYFQTQQAKYAVITNGVTWKWYREDPEGYPGKLAPEPFLVDDTRKVNDHDTDLLYNLHPDRFDSKTMDLKALQSGARSKVLEWFHRNLREPDPDFVSFLIGNLRLSKSATQENLAVMADPVRNALNQVITDRIESSLDRARHSPVETAKEPPISVGPNQPARKPVRISPKKDRPALPILTEWIPLQEYEKFYPNGKAERGIGQIVIEVQMADGSIHLCKGWANLARQVIDWVDSRIDERAVGTSRSVSQINGTRIFGNTDPISSSGTKFLKAHHAKRMNLHFELGVSAKDLILGLQGLLATNGWGENQIRIRTPQDNLGVPQEASKHPDTQKAPVEMPYVDDWASIQQWESFYPSDEIEGRTPSIYMEFRLPDGTITQCRGFAHVSRMIIDWVDTNASSIPYTNEARLVTLPNSQKMFGNFEPKNRVGTDFRNPYEAKRIGVHFEFNHTAENIAKGTLAFLEKFQVDPQQFCIRSQRKS